MSAKVSVVLMCMDWGGVWRCLWCRCVWAGDECGGVCGVGVYVLGMSAGMSCVVSVYGLGMSAKVSECVVGLYGLGMSAGCLVLSVCIGWG